MNRWRCPECGALYSGPPNTAAGDPPRCQGCWIELVPEVPESPYAVPTECPQCGGELHPEHAHYKCRGCGWRDGCCD